LYGNVVIAILAFLINISLGHKVWSAALGLGGLALLLTAVLPKWKDFR
jgi:hypothetical protein